MIAFWLFVFEKIKELNKARDYNYHLRGKYMSEDVNTRVETKEAEVDYITEIHKDMVENGKHWYTNSYDFTNGDRVKITVEITG